MNSRKFKKLSKYLLLLIIAGIITLLGINFYIVKSCEKDIISIEEAAKLNDTDAIIVLGCKVREDGPSLMLKDRLEVGTKLYFEGAAPKILMSGDHGRKTYDEVNAMKNFALKKGIPSEDIFMDHAGFSTYESMYRARDIFEADKLIIVTQEYHLYRSLYIAQKLGLDAKGVASDLHTYGGNIKGRAREVLARNKDFIKTIFKPRPTYLGEVIPISGNGDLTND